MDPPRRFGRSIETGADKTSGFRTGPRGPEQDHLVRAPFHPTVCVQGAPGTGKTAVGLHRLAYLLYAEPARLGGGVPEEQALLIWPT